ncbi:MAG: 30S ribosomal protein S1 [Candidatus Eisenbacteria bacterium]
MDSHEKTPEETPHPVEREEGKPEAEKLPVEPGEPESAGETAADEPAPSGASPTPEPSGEEAPKGEAHAEDDSPEPASGEEGAAKPPAETGGAEFRARLEESLSETMSGEDLAVGARVTGKLVQIGDPESFVDYGGRSEGVIATREFKDEKGQLRHAVGDTIHATVESVEGQVVLTLGRRPGPVDKEQLRKKYESKIPVEGTVRATNKGGFEVYVAGRRAFCPFSQIDIAYCDNPDKFVGRKLPFLITRFDGGGRNIVVSRRAILEEERKLKAEETEARLAKGEVFDGIVCRVLPFGAFVDIGGVEGLLHVSELSHSHVADPSKVLSPGDEIKVSVIAIDEGEKGRRVSLSRKALEPDPWTSAASSFKPGSLVEGKVARLTDFGAFVEIAPGVDGLLHVSEISLRHIKHPKEELSPGDTVEVRILDIDMQKRRIALSRKAVEADQHRSEEKARVTEQRKRNKEKRAKDQASAPSSGETPASPSEPMDVLLDRLKKKYEDDSLG